MPVLSAALVCLVVGVSDGDTLTARCEAQADQPAQTIKVRLAEIDAPERGQAFGNRSKQHLSDVCFKRQAEVRPQTTDRYGRTVARINCDGIDANMEMVRSGMDWEFTKYLTDPQIKAIEIEARAERRGLWVDRESAAPWEWRNGNRGRTPRDVL